MSSSSVAKRVVSVVCVVDAIVAVLATLMPWLVVEFQRPDAPRLVDQVDMWHLDLYNGPFWRQVSPLWVTAGAVCLLIVAGGLSVRRARRWTELAVVTGAAVAAGCIAYGTLRPTIVGGPLGQGASEARGHGYWVCVASATAAGVVSIALLLHVALSARRAGRARP